LVGGCLLESRLELFGARDGRAKSTISARQSGKIRVLERGADNPAGEAAFLMHADRAVHRIVKQENDRTGPFKCRRRQLLAGHHKAAIAAKAYNQAAGVNELGRDRGGHPIAHSAARGAELPSRSAVLQKAVRPAAEVPGVAGDDSIVREAVAQPFHDFPEIQRGACWWRYQPALVFRAHSLA